MSYKDCVERAYKWFISIRMSFSACAKGWSYTVATGRRGMAESVFTYLAALDRFPKTHNRLQNVIIELLDFRNLIKKYDTPSTLFYLDPPYISTTRKAPNVYKHEMSIEDHQDLIDILLNIKGHAVLSGYNNEIYTPLEKAGWYRQDFDTYCRAPRKIKSKESFTNVKPKRTESIWTSFKVREFLK